MTNRQKLRLIILSFALALVLSLIARLGHTAPDTRSKFYDFSDQLIDGEVKQPTALYTDSRQEVRFKRLLSLKREFTGDVLQRTARDRVFK